MSSANIISKLLGLGQDHGSHGTHGPGHGQVQHQSPLLKGGVQAQGGWNGALQSMKLSDAWQGINVTPNFLFLVLFLGFTFWLFVVYWIRHHEPLANSVLGTGAAQSATAAADRRLVAGIKKTLPVRTSHSTGDFYVPVPHGGEIVGSGQFAGSAYGYPQQTGIPLPAPPLPPQPAPQPQPTPLSYNPYMTPQQPYVQPAGDAYMVPIQHSAGTRVKMIVNR